eukprot:TRINITY_DN7680_c0_g1_i2.p1 TRINITY_DN7680_c0_g1~~TRINITY_DN7680_c0_g1_i2.p1  ORF type:complete len:154 (-),score=41.76 TRINITY_DN7680_c0_g1_i2:96-557(-)
MYFSFFFFQAEDGIRDHAQSRGLGDVYKRQLYISMDSNQKQQENQQITKQKERDLSEQELIVYDRQRFISIEVQRKLINSNVMICCVNGVNTELAKNLILCGANITIFDNNTITQDDVCLLYTSDAADDMQCVDLGGRRIIKKKKKNKHMRQV